MAMLLVLISLATATIMTSAYVASRDNSALLGRNAANAAQARWAAAAGLEIGIAILQTEADWRTAHVSGRLLEAYPLNGASVDLDLTDVLTGAPPDATTEYVALVAGATVDGLRQTSAATVHVPRTGAAAPGDVDLSEFAVFGRDGITFEDKTFLTRWPNATMSDLGLPVTMGTRATAAGTVSARGTAALVDTLVFGGPDASTALVLVENGPQAGLVKLPFEVPMPAPPSPPAPAPAFPGEGEPVMFKGGSVTIGGDLTFGTIDVMANTTLTIAGDATVVTTGDLNLQPHSRILVDGNVRLVVFDDLDMTTDSTIELLDGARLQIFVADQLFANAAYIGTEIENAAARDNQGGAPYFDVERLMVYSIPAFDPNGGEPGTASPDWELSGGSVTLGQVYAPDADLRVRHDSAFYGRIAVRTVSVENDAAVYYDHALGGGGYTDPSSPLLDGDGMLLDGFSSLGSLDAADLEAASELTQTLVTSGDATFGETTVAIDPNPGPGAAGATPRPVPVDVTYCAFGLAIHDIECP